MSTAVATKKCPRCGTDSRELVRIDAGMRIALAEGGMAKEIPGEACTNCIGEFSKLVSQGARLRAQRKAREANQVALWRNRINVLKQGRTFLAQRLFVEAAIEFEKYIRIIEIVSELKPGELKPEHLKKNAKSNELDVFISTLWDLIKIYDMNASYQPKLKEKVEMIVEFSKQAPSFPRLARKMVAYSKKAKNKEVFNDLLTRCNAPKSKCFIATSTYGDPLHPQVLLLTRFRDETLENNVAGRIFIWIYYKVSPLIADFLDKNPHLKTTSRNLLDRIAKKVQILLEKKP
ncbi:MAG: hypothetical protein A4S09_08485 [Proteobacteria bacterium SG_bin7]|nr:MAG: hypothetical protein A4S09_08485 [Proteobacteria bacterium SG_bin7]